MAEAKCLAINPLQPELLAVGCNDPFVRLYDHRMLSSHSFSEVKKPSSSNSSSPEDAKLPPGCVQYFAPGHLPPQLGKDSRRRFRAYVATYINFSPNGRELIANLGGEQIYLFDIKRHRKVMKYQAVNGLSSSLASNGVVKSVVDNLGIPSTKNGFSSSANGATNGYKIPTLNGKRTASDKISLKPIYSSNHSINISQELPPKALELKEKGNDAFCQQQFWTAVNLYNEAIFHACDSAVLYANRAAAYIKRAWYVTTLTSLSLKFIALFNNMRTVQFKAHHAKFVLRCRQSCCGPLRKQAQYFREVNRSRSWFVIGGFLSICLFLLLYDRYD